MTPTASPGLMTRLACGLYEVLLLAGVLVLAGFVLVPFGQVLNHDNTSLQLYNRAWMMLVITVYFTWFWTHGGQTLPMKTWRMRVVRRDGGALSPALALARMLLVFLGIALLGLPFAWAFADPEGLYLHDRLLGTRLIRITG